MGPILSGMFKVMEAGTGFYLKEPAGVRVYGKTGTADSIGIKDEMPWGVERGVFGRPHSWFIAIAEPMDTTLCEPTNPRRLAVAVVVPRSATGASVAGPAAMDILAAAQKYGYFPSAQQPEAVAGAVPGAPGSVPAAVPSPSPSPSPVAQLPGSRGATVPSPRPPAPARTASPAAPVASPAVPVASPAARPAAPVASPAAPPAAPVASPSAPPSPAG